MSERFYLVKRKGYHHFIIRDSYEKAVQDCQPGDELITTETVMVEKCVQDPKRFETRGIHNDG